MSVGGKVIEVIKLPEKVWVNTLDRGPTECAIYVERNSDSEQIEIGDTLWWHGVAYWTKNDESIVEREIKRVGFSGVNRPIIGEN